MKRGRGCRKLGAVKISIVVPAFNEERLIGESLAQIKSAAGAFAKIGWETELIVCDNNSKDRTTEIARAAGAIVVFEPINQIARARNSGAAAATGDWLFFVDADSHPSAELFADAADAIRSGKCLAGGATVQMDETKFTLRFVIALWNRTSRLKKWMSGAFIFVEAVAFRQIGGFSRELFATEELDLSNRLKQLARTTGKKIVILHRHSIKTSARKLKLYTLREILNQFARAIFRPRRTLSSREATFYWYDGRR
ncbi:MAG TPA: glycosyltransferase [Dongiaceae bacterium]|nr:glycosyltransferase [Dongiaceae bacterium]